MHTSGVMQAVVHMDRFECDAKCEKFVPSVHSVPHPTSLSVETPVTPHSISRGA